MNILLKSSFYLIAFMGMALVYESISNIGEGAGSANWPTVGGEIIKSEIVTRNTYNGSRWTFEKFSEILYGYEVRGVKYTNSRITFDGSYPDRGDGKATEFPLGRKVTVFYNPGDPDDAVLFPVRNTGEDNFGMALMGIVFAGMGISAIWITRGKRVDQ